MIVDHLARGDVRPLSPVAATPSSDKPAATQALDRRGLARHGRAMSPASLWRPILAIALPSMLTNVATALFGLADMWVIGRLGRPPPRGAWRSAPSS